MSFMARKYLGEYISHVCSSGKRRAVGLCPNMPSPDPQCGRLGATGTQPLTRNPSTPGASKISAWFITSEGGGWGKGRGVQNSHFPEASSYILQGDFSDFLVPAAAESAPCSAPRAHCPPLPPGTSHSTVMCVPVPHRWKGPWKQGHNLFVTLSRYPECYTWQLVASGTACPRNGLTDTSLYLSPG